MNTHGVYDLLKKADLQNNHYAEVRTIEIYSEPISTMFTGSMSAWSSVYLGPSTLLTHCRLIMILIELK